MQILPILGPKICKHDLLWLVYPKAIICMNNCLLHDASIFGCLDPLGKG